MKCKYLFLLAFSVWLAGVTTAIATPLRSANQFNMAARFTPDQSTTALDTYRNCQTASPAVVTVYAGNETGSGSIVGSKGLIVTSNHVVNDRAGNQPVLAQMIDGRQYQGQVIKTDTRNDLALIQLHTQEQFPTVPLAQVNEIQLGQSVCAIGSPYGRPGVLSEGVLSLVRSNGDLQAKIRLYPGNSGGPLLDPQGALIGVNRAILESPAGRNTGISFATSVQAVRNLMGLSNATLSPSLVTRQSVTKQSPPDDQLFTVPDATFAVMEQAKARSTQPTLPAATFPFSSKAASPPARGLTVARGRLGITMDTQNLVVQQVQTGSAAFLGGFRPGDRLLAINGKQLGGFSELQTFLQQQPSTAIFTLDRQQQQTNVQVNF